MFWPFIEIDSELSHCLLADFGALHVREGKDIYAKAAVAQPLTGHIKLFNPARVAGKIVLMERGKCDFVTKVLHAQAAGTIAVIVTNSDADDPNAAFIMDAGTRRSAAAAVQIPAMMLSSAKASVVFDQTRGCYLDRREFALTIKFLGVQAAALVLESIETSAKQKQQHEMEEQRRHDLEKQQLEASRQLRSWFGQQATGSSGSSSVSTPSSTPRAAWGAASKTHRKHTKRLLQDAKAASSDGSVARSRSFSHNIESGTYETSSLAPSSSSNNSNYSSSNYSPSSCYMGNNHATARTGSISITNHWCPMTTALLILDVKNYFALHENETCVFEPQSGSSQANRLAYYKRINSVMVPTIQDVLLASRAREGMEVVYSIVKSATQDGRDRSRAHKHAGIHVAKSGFGAKILARVAPTDNDIVIPRTGINIFEATNVDYTLHNLGVSHLVVVGTSTLSSIHMCIQSALDKGYQVTVLREGVALEQGANLPEWLETMEQLGCQVQSASAFANDLHSFSAEPSFVELERTQFDGKCFKGTNKKRKRQIKETMDAVSCSSGNASAYGGDDAERAYACSDLKQRYDEVVVDDARGIGGFLWKFPSEGSNHAVGALARREKQEPYPRKCGACHDVWVSSTTAERQHQRRCRGPSSDKAHKHQTRANGLVPGGEPHAAGSRKLGVARRVWCEVDSSLSRFQWREAADSEQGVPSCSVSFLEIRSVAVLNEPASSFQINTTASPPRTLVFQCRPNNEARTCISAAQWGDYLRVFSHYARQQGQAPIEYSASNNQHSPTASLHEAGRPLPADSTTAFDEVTFTRITRAIVSDDVAVLQQIPIATGESAAHEHLRIRDESGSSLLLVALKLGATPPVIEALLRAGVGCNLTNSDQESPLLLVAASGDAAMLQLLLQAEGIDVNQPCALGATAFHAAANAGDPKILEVLCAAGATPSAVDADGWTALHYVAACPSGMIAMHFLCELIPELIDHQCNDGNTALHVASGYGCADNVRVLLQTAANPHLQNHDGHTAYHIALHNHKIPCAAAINECVANSLERYALPSSGRVGMAGEKTAPLPPSYCSNSTTVKESAVSAVSMVDAPHSDLLLANGWTECTTPDGLPYFYNAATGQSMWHRPPEEKAQSATDLFGPPWDGEEDQLLAGVGAGLESKGHELPLCLIPMVSLLVSLDDPTAATKLESKRRKAREKRRAIQRHHMQSAPETA